MAHKKWIVIVSIALFAGALFIMIKTTPSSFVPNEDQGTVFAAISLPPASSMERTNEVARQIDSMAHTIPSVRNTLRLVGFNFIAGSGSAYCYGYYEIKNLGFAQKMKACQNVIDKLTLENQRHARR